MTSFALKIIACITMFIDHLSYSLYGKLTWLNYIGRLAFPIFAYQIVEGYTHTKNIKKYFARLFIFAIVSQIPFYLFHSIISDQFSLNVMFTLLLGLLCIWIWENMPSKLISSFIVFALCLVAEVANMDYGYWGVLLVFVFHLCKDNKIKTSIAFLAMVMLHYIPRIIMNTYSYVYSCLIIGTLCAIIPILLYNGKKGRKIKYILYIFYPVHLLILYGIHLII